MFPCPHAHAVATFVQEARSLLRPFRSQLMCEDPCLQTEDDAAEPQLYTQEPEHDYEEAPDEAHPNP
ncbi:unnamed protein product [Cylicocyclus nassatus]|uniref:Uncharacterized protein n=1 Tax=Cylicocyclus nassatus TaxID=53992 RepID=A0AA36MB09_CYLNA|nr:unnamed protein product [Cylicocyclus nassatus]